MNPQGHNAQQNNPPPHAAPPAGRWDEGANLNNAPAPQTLPPPRTPWRQRCADAGYIAGDEQVQPYVQNRPLLDDDGQMNTAGLYGFIGTADSINADRAKGIDRPLAELAVFMQTRNWTMDAIDDALAALDERTRAGQDAAQALLHGKQTGASHEVLVALQATLDQCESDVEKLRSALSAEQGALRKLQTQVAQAQRMVLRMLHGEQPVGSIVGPAQGGAVQLIPDPTVISRVLRLADRHPGTTASLVLIVLLILTISLVDLFHEPRPGESPEDERAIRLALAGFSCFLLVFMCGLERLLAED